jgi:diguanylate cyclase (GGDEF)-like protein/PAS domain S-box-containing protein
MKEKVKSTIVLIAAIACLSIWAGYSAVNTFLFRHGAFTGVVLPEMLTRERYLLSFFIIGIFICGVVIYRVLSEQKYAEEVQRETEITLRAVTDAANDAIVMVNPQGAITFWNPAAEKTFGYCSVETIGSELHALLAPQRYYEDYKTAFGRFQALGEGAAIGRTIELTALRKDGVEIPIELSLSALRLKEKWHAVGIIRDITERKKSEAALRTHQEQLENLVAERTEELNAANELLRKEIKDRTRTEEELYRSESFLSTIFDSFRDPFSIVDRNYTLIKFNDAYARATGKRVRDLFGKRCYEVLKGRDSVCSECTVEKTFQSKDPCAKEKLQTMPDGAEAWIEIFTYPIFDQNHNVSHVVEYSRDITERKKNEEEKKELIKNLNHLSTTDGLTGLLNRRALNDILRHEIDRACRYDTDLSLIICDVDKFKAINDTYGHTAGDRALRIVADTLKNALRKADIPGRYGGDEFMVILPETSLSGAKSLAEKIRVAVHKQALELPENNIVRLSLSLGVASCCSPLNNIDTIVALADTALYSAKQAGRNQVSIMKKT